MKKTVSRRTSHVSRISRLLIANRGEIAVRIIRTCREMGITPIAVYSEADEAALHVRLADEAYYVGPAPATQSYLDIKKIIAAARKAGADAIHPGYGFLAENPDFATAVTKAGLIWVGPPAKIIKLLGSKIAARKIAVKAKVPVVPGTAQPLRSFAKAGTAAKQIGFPLLLKAIAGGGGKGMRVVETPADFESAFELARGEAESAFGNGDLYLEKYLRSPHHIEVQILADKSGNVVHFGERECSIQRRHQKIIEETPSPFITPALRKKICAAAVRIAKAAGYRSAGTVEFLVDAKRNFYFLEVNTRIQVEHPITELVTGVDLIAEQLHLASGKALRLKQNKIRSYGHAIECRLYAEDPFQNFFPSPGIIEDLLEPHGSGVRMDSGIYAGGLVPMEYDPILGKLCTWGPSRADAIARMQRSLLEYRISGVKTNLYLHTKVLQHPDFVAGKYDTNFLAQHGDELLQIPMEETEHALISAAIARALSEASAAAPSLAPSSAWKTMARHQGVRSGMDLF